MNNISGKEQTQSLFTRQPALALPFEPTAIDFATPIAVPRATRRSQPAPQPRSRRSAASPFECQIQPKGRSSGRSG